MDEPDGAVRPQANELGSDSKVMIDKMKEENEKLKKEIDGVFDVDGDEEKDAEESRDEGRAVIRMLDPKLPSPAEVEQHDLTHVPYRNWCRHCVRGRGKEAAHKKMADKMEREMAEFHCDFCFPGDEDNKKNLIVLVMRERSSRMTVASVVPTKSSGEFIAKRLSAFIREVVMKAMTSW